MDLQALEAFVEFSKTMNFTRAAESLHISQPALHVKVNKLAQDLGVTLYSKRGRVLTLTNQGVELVRFARETSRSIEDFLQTLSPGASGSPVVLAAGSGSYLHLLGPAIQTFKSSHSAKLSALTADSTGTLELIRTGVAHMGVTVLDFVPPDVESELIHTAPGLLVVRDDHRLANRKRLALDDLENLELIVPPLGKPHRETLARTLRTHNVSWKVSVEAPGWDLMTHFTSLGLGAAVINGCCLIPDGLKGIPINGYPHVNYYLVRKRSLRFSAEQQGLWDIIRS